MFLAFPHPFPPGYGGGGCSDVQNIGAGATATFGAATSFFAGGPIVAVARAPVNSSGIQNVKYVGYSDVLAIQDAPGHRQVMLQSSLLIGLRLVEVPLGGSA